MSAVTKEKVEEVLKNLKAEKSNLPEFSMFGDNNWETADTQISIIEKYLETGVIAPYENAEDVVYDVSVWLDKGDSRSDFGECYYDET